MTDDDKLELRILQLETDIALANHNINHIMKWIESRIFADNTVDKRKNETDRRFLAKRFNV